MAIMPAPKDYTGTRFGRLIAISDDGNAGGYRRWIWRCDCGAMKSILVSNVRSGKIVSCGCNKREKSTRHGRYQTRTYKIWTGIKQRTDGRRSGYSGVSICERWRSFENFLEDMGECPIGLTLDRKNNSKGYGPDNCRWATRLDQTLNRECVIWVDVNGASVSLREACRILKLPYSTVHHRVHNLNMAPEQALRAKKWQLSTSKAGRSSKSI
jgi:hypothetical protein